MKVLYFKQLRALLMKTHLITIPIEISCIFTKPLAFPKDF